MGLIFAAGLVAVIGGAWFLASRADVGRRKLYEEAAAALGGRVKSMNDVAHMQWVVASLRGVEVTVGLREETSGKATLYYRRVTAPLIHPNGFGWLVYRQGILSAIAKTFGSQDVDLGVDPGFDRDFVVKTRSRAVTRRYWTDKTSCEALRFFRRGEVWSDGETITFEEVGGWDGALAMTKAAHLIAGLASTDVFGAGVSSAAGGIGLVHVPGASFRILSSGPEAELTLPVRVVVRAEELDERLITVARYEGLVKIPPLTLSLDGDAGKRAELSRGLPQAAQVHLAKAGEGRLVVASNGVVFMWPDIEMDPQRLRAGADLVGALAAAAGDGGLYR